MTSRRLTILLLIVVVAVGAVGVALLAPRGTSEITDEAALEDFRSRSGGEVTSAGVDEAASQVPAPGVYTYAASGEEVVQLGPLPAETRPFPDTVRAVAHDTGDECFDWRLNLFAEHTETTRYCVQDGQLLVDGHTKRQQIGALSPTATMTCDPGTLPTVGHGSTQMNCELELSGGPAKVVVELAGPASTGEPETVEVGNEQVRATPITVDLNATGDLSGSWTETTWWDLDHLPVRIDRSLELRGVASFREVSRLELITRRPAT